MKKKSLSATTPRVAIVYDRVNSWGGAERTLLSLRHIFPDAPLYTSVYEPSKAPWAQGWEVRPSWLQRIPWLRSRHQLVGWLMPVVFESLQLADFDIIISVTSEAAKAVLTRPEQLHICYLLTPTRYLWSHQGAYLEQLPRWLQTSARRLMTLLQRWDQVLALRPDIYVPISRLVADRCQTYYGRPTQPPLYPPLPGLPPAEPPPVRPPQPFFFTWGRHVAYKAVEVAIAAAVAEQQVLLIAGRGPKTKTWQKLAHRLDPEQRFIFFIGNISDAELTWYLQHAQAAIFPQQEDFGLTALEAVSQGCPVIVHRHSGVAEILRPGKDALFLDQTNVAMLGAAMKKAIAIPWSRLDIQEQASQYAEAVWQKTFFDMVTQQWHQHQKQNEGVA